GSPIHRIVKSTFVAVVAKPERLKRPTSPAVLVTQTLPSTANEDSAFGAKAWASTGSAARYLPRSSSWRQICPDAVSSTYRLPLKLTRPVRLFQLSRPSALTSTTVLPSA